MIAPVDIASLRHKILIRQRSSGTPDASGQRSYTYSTVATTRASIGPISSREVERAHSFGANTSFLIKIRYRPSITSAMQVVFAGNGVSRTFVINGIINPEEQNIMLHLFCEELSAGAT